ncbi:BRO family, N-terminal domain [Izhakiella capsodis]|uniref:BRO family, N-terminal domain n=1 Tax=Izhakiella capsodis TaxID=1367852 RepID=A0A1I5BC09_9GAMM|nr:BRO family, N-terminal domain [Izhakiella capsodis]
MATFTFQNHSLKAHAIDGRTRFESADIAKALGYADKRSVSGLYANYKSEFEKGMSLVVDSTTNGINNSLRKISVRIFSLRGVHLIAMFARTPVAEEFRKWVLDLLDREAGQVKQPTIVVAPHRECLPKMVYHRKSKYNPYSAWASNNGKNVYVGCFPTVEEAVAAQHRYFEEGEIKRIHKAKQNSHPVARADFVNHLKTILEAAQLLSCYECGKELAWELVAFSQEEAQRFA